MEKGGSSEGGSGEGGSGEGGSGDDVRFESGMVTKKVFGSFRRQLNG